MKIQRLVDPDKRFAVTFVNTTAFFFREGVWRHSIFVPRWNIKERNTHVSRKSCIIQPIRRRLRHYWSVSRYVYHMHQTFSQRFVGVTSEAETNIGRTHYLNISFAKTYFLFASGNKRQLGTFNSESRNTSSIKTSSKPKLFVLWFYSTFCGFFISLFFICDYANLRFACYIVLVDM